MGTSRFVLAATGGIGALRRLASLKLTVVLIAWTAAAVSYGLETGAPLTWHLAAPMAGIALNLSAAIATNPVFRRQTALLMFHLALIAIVALVALGRLTYLRGSFELTTGVPFDGTLAQREAGPWHHDTLAAARFVSEGFEIGYSPGLRRGPTLNTVRWRDEAGRPQVALIGDQVPLKLEGYSFYTTHNKGFAGILHWQPRGGEALLGSVHFPSYPLFQFDQTLQWQLPGTSTPARLTLDIDETLIDSERAGAFRMPSRHAIAIESGGVKARLRPGERVELAEGVLTYERLTTWMGYQINADWTMPWLLAACVLAVGALGWHFRRKFAAHPWRPQ